MMGKEQEEEVGKIQGLPGRESRLEPWANR